MSDTSAPQHGAVANLRAALRAADPTGVARGLQHVPAAIGLDGTQPRVAIDGDRRLLPVFLDMDSWSAFGLPGQPMLLDAEKLRALLEALTHVDDVLFDPALPSAMRLPRADLVRLLSAAPDAETADFDQDEHLAVQARAALRAGDSPATATAWAVQRITAVGSTPAIAVARDADDAAIEAIGVALARADLPRDLELVQLDESWTRTARDAWAAVAVA